MLPEGFARCDRNVQYLFIALWCHRISLTEPTAACNFSVESALFLSVRQICPHRIVRHLSSSLVFSLSTHARDNSYTRFSVGFCEDFHHRCIAIICGQVHEAWFSFSSHRMLVFISAEFTLRSVHLPLIMPCYAGHFIEIHDEFSIISALMREEIMLQLTIK